MKHKNYDVALLLGAYIDNVALLPVLHLFGIKTILKTTIASGEFLANSFTQKVKSSLIVRSVDQFIVLNDELRNELVNIGVDLKKINIIPNGIEIKTEFKVRNNEQKMVFSIIGEVNDRKGVIESIEVISKYQKQYFINVAGPQRDRKYQRRLEQLLKRKNIPNKIWGEVGSEAIAAIYADTDILVTSSKREGMPNVVLEALSYGIPVIASPIEAHKNLIKSGYNGYIIDDYFDISAFETQYSRLSRNAQESILQYDISDVSDSYFKLITG